MTTIPERIRNIAHWLGSDWTYQAQYNWNGRLIHESGATLWIAADTSMADSWTRFEIHALWPKDKAGHTWHPEGQPNGPKITVTMDKTDPQIAQDIERRLLPDYLSAWHKVEAKRKAANEHYRELDQLVERIGQATGATVRPKQHKAGHPRLVSQLGSPTSYNAEINHDGNFTFEAQRVSPDQLEAIINILEGEPHDR